MFVGGTLHFRDLAQWIFPAWSLVGGAVRHGDWPFWNPYEGLGFSTLANPLYGLFYPPNLLIHIVPPELAVTWLLFLHALWGGAGFLLLARRLGARPEGAVIAGLAWTLSGFISAEWNAGLRVAANAWVPWIALALIGVAGAATNGRRATLRAAAVAAIPIGLAFLLGEVFIAFIAFGFGSALAACTLAFGSTRPTRAIWARFAIGTVLGSCAGGAVGAIAIIPARFAAGGTERAGALSRSAAEGCSLHPARLLEMVAPQLFGHPFGGLKLVGQGCVEDKPILFSVYLGASVVALALLAIGRRRRLEAALAFLSIAALLTSFGRYTPVHAILRTLVPPLAFMRHPEKYVAFVVAPVALLAALGFGRWLEADHKVRSWPRVAILTAVLLGLATLARTFLPQPLATGMSGALMRGGAAAGVILAIGVLGRLARAFEPFVPALLVATVAVDLGGSSSVLLEFGPRHLATDVPAAAEEVLAHNSAAPAPARVYRPAEVSKSVLEPSTPRDYPEAERRLTETLAANTANAFQVANVIGYDAAIPIELLRSIGQGRAQGVDMLRLFAVGHAILPIANLADLVDHRPHLKPLFDPVPGARLYRVPEPLPRVYLAGSAAVLDDEPARKELFSPAVVAGGRVLLAPGPGSRPLPASAARAGDCTLQTFSETHLSIHCRADREAVAVLVEQFDLGWTVFVDGRPAPLLRANLVERGVMLPPGEHHIEMRFSPPGLVAGAALAAFGLVTIALTLVLTRRPIATVPPPT